LTQTLHPVEQDLHELSVSSQKSFEQVEHWVSETQTSQLEPQAVQVLLAFLKNVVLQVTHVVPSVQFLHPLTQASQVLVLLLYH
jgi:hypothetical protein